MNFIPLLGPSFESQSHESFHAYVRTLYREPPKPEPLPEYAVRTNKKGNLVITVRREPKFLLPAEVDKLASEIGCTKQAMWLEVCKRGIEIQLPPTKGKWLNGRTAKAKGRTPKGKPKSTRKKRSAPG